MFLIVWPDRKLGAICCGGRRCWAVVGSETDSGITLRNGVVIEVATASSPW